MILQNSSKMAYVVLQKSLNIIQPQIHPKLALTLHSKENEPSGGKILQNSSALYYITYAPGLHSTTYGQPLKIPEYEEWLSTMGEKDKEALT